MRLNGYTYRFKTKADVSKKEAGVIAQEVLEVLPEAMSENADGTLAVSYNSLVPLLINAVKEQQATTLQQTQKASLENAIQMKASAAALPKDVDALHTELVEMRAERARAAQQTVAQHW